MDMEVLLLSNLEIKVSSVVVWLKWNETEAKGVRFIFV